MSLLQALQERLEERVEKEVEESSKDIAYATEFLAENEEVGRPINKIISLSTGLKIALAIIFGFSSYILVQSLNQMQIIAVAYLAIGTLTAKVSEYGWGSWKSWFTVVAWLPAVILGVIKKVVT